MTEKMEADGGGTVVVGYALPEKKVESFITPSLLAVAQQRRINLIPIDLTKPLLDQGTFHCIIHKLYSPEWNQQLRDYSSRNPSVPVIDPPHAVRRLHDRVSMLRVVSDIHHSVGIPNQICVQNAADLADLNNLDFPLIAKAMLSNGTDNSHQMYLILNRRGLRELKMEAPFVLQQFVSHGGVLFKVYVVGDHVSCVTRNSLPDYVINPEDDDSRPGLIPFSQISNLRTGCDRAAEVAMPPARFVTEVAMELRKGLELNLFNFDVIREKSNNGEEKYYIIDINYFPGYAKLPNYEALFTDFLLHSVSTTN